MPSDELLKATDMQEMDARGLSVLRDESGALARTPNGGVVIVVKADRFYHRDEDSVRQTLWLLFAFATIVTAQAPYAAYRSVAGTLPHHPLVEPPLLLRGVPKMGTRLGRARDAPAAS